MKRPVIIVLVVLALFGACLIGWLLVPEPAPPARGAITLPDGSWARLEAVTYGTNHVVAPKLAHLVSHLPQAIQNSLRKHLGRRAMIRFTHQTPSPMLVLWLNRDISAKPFPTNQGYFECVLSGTNGTTCGQFVGYAARYPLETKEFAVFPRREKTLVLTIYHHDAEGNIFERGYLTFPNPEYRRYPHWKPEPLPATKFAGDVKVTLGKLVTGIEQTVEFTNSVHGHQVRFTTNAPLGTSITVCDLRMEPTRTNEQWAVVRVVTSDATGNQVGHDLLTTDDESGEVIFSPALWPDESAWKVAFEIARRDGFGSGEVISFPGLPIPATNGTNLIGWTTNFQGLQVTLEQMVRREADLELRLGVTGLTNGHRLDLISAAGDTGEELTRYFQSDLGTNQIHRFKAPPAGAKRATFTFAVQPSRWVEFLAKPEKKRRDF